MEEIINVMTAFRQKALDAGRKKAIETLPVMPSERLLIRIGVKELDGSEEQKELYYLADKYLQNMADTLPLTRDWGYTDDLLRVGAIVNHNRYRLGYELAVNLDMVAFISGVRRVKDELDKVSKESMRRAA